jgi:RimJ/RimL family protein N-acetyltransferase
MSVFADGGCVPELRGERVVLRPLREGDAFALAREAGSAQVARTLRGAFPHPYTVDAARWFIGAAGSSGGGGFGLVWAITQGGDVIGTVALAPPSAADLAAAATSPLGAELRGRRCAGELGYWLGEAHWGKGLASEAAALVLGWSAAESSASGVGAFVLVGVCARENPASERVLSKLGFRLVARQPATFVPNAAAGLSPHVRWDVDLLALILR